MLESLETSFVQKLSPIEANVYLELPSDLRSAFRIFRDLAQREDTNAARGQFFMSCAELAQRLGLTGCVPADRILKKFQGWGLIEVVTKGERWMSGTKARATLYAWKLALETSALTVMEPDSEENPFEMGPVKQEEITPSDDSWESGEELFPEHFTIEETEVF